MQSAFSLCSFLPRMPRSWSLGVMAATLSLSACGDPAHDLKVGTVGYVNGFAGTVVASEPRAVLVGRDTLSAGGTAADAAVAMAFTLSATLPTSVGLGAGGLCLVHDRATKKTQVLDFFPPPASLSMKGASQQTGSPVAVPALPRAMYALYAQSGRLRWEQLLAPAENIARFGEPVSRALSHEIGPVAGRIGNDPLARRIFAADGGRRPIQEGDTMTQLDLATVIGRLRQKGVGDLYGGQLGAQYVEAVRQLGGQVTIEGMRAYSPQWRETTTAQSGNETIHFPGEPITGSETAKLWNAGALTSSIGDEKVPAIGGSSFMAVDADGSAVVCAVSLNGPFGAGRIIPSTGLFAVAPSPDYGRSRMPLGVALVINEHVNEFRFAAAAAGGGAFNHVARAVQGFVDEKPVADSLKEISDAPSGAALLNAASCPQGLPSHPGSCGAAVDPRGNGYALLVGAPRS